MLFTRLPQEKLLPHHTCSQRDRVPALIIVEMVEVLLSG